MRKFAVPATHVLGATRRMDPDRAAEQLKDKRGRLLWDMPNPILYVEHTRRRKHKTTGEVINEPVMVPVYRGISTSDARRKRFQHRRALVTKEKKADVNR